MPVKIKYIDDGIGVEFIAEGVVTGVEPFDAYWE